MRRILYYDSDLNLGFGSNLEVVGVGNLDGARRLLEKEKFDLIGINAGTKYALEFAEYIGDNTRHDIAAYDVVVLVKPPTRLASDHVYREETNVKNAVPLSRLLACKNRRVRTQKNLGILIQVLNELSEFPVNRI
ncbi:hypothetical protein HYT57_03420 [Candidatus Woesearchaeota archaeon]|nr:hypothetical protein [Candidatus Woesearchaeota archaeon]